MSYQSIVASDVERLLFYMPTVAERSASEWARSFASSILKQSRRRKWRPTHKQLTLMQRLVKDLFIHGYAGGDVDVIE